MALSEAAHPVLVREQEYKLRSVMLQRSSLRGFLICCLLRDALNAFVSHFQLTCQAIEACHR